MLSSDSHRILDRSGQNENVSAVHSFGWHFVGQSDAGE